MTIQINGYALDPQPTAGGWVRANPLYDDHEGRPQYPAIRSYELRWDALTSEGIETLYRLWYQYATGTCSVTLPALHRGYAYEHDLPYYTYSGCTIEYPEMGTYFSDLGTLGFKLVIRNVRPILYPTTAA